MIKKSPAPSIKKEQKKAFILKEVSAFVRQVTAEEPSLIPLFVTRIELSRDTGVCYVYFSTYTDRVAFEDGLKILKLYKPSMRKALADAMRSRYVPQLVFRYDEAKEKERRITGLLDEIQQEESSGEKDGKDGSENEQ